MKLSSKTLAELCSQIGADIVEQSNLLNGVCQSHRKLTKFPLARTIEREHNSRKAKMHLGVAWGCHSL